MRIEVFYGADRILQRAMYGLRSERFAEFSPEEQMVFWQFDPVSTHILVFDNQLPLGSISIGDYTGYDDIHKQFGLDRLIEGYSPNLRIKGVHRLASTGNILVLRTLLEVAQEEIRKDCDFCFGYTAPSKNVPHNMSRHKLGVKYCSLSGAQQIGTKNHEGVVQHFFGKWV